MTFLLNYLANNPLFGMLSGFYSSILAYAGADIVNAIPETSNLELIPQITTYLGMIIGVLIGSLTIIGLILKNYITFYEFRQRIKKDRANDK